MIVELIQATPNAGQMVADIASICYGKDEAANPERLLKSLYRTKHHSTLEHVYYTFKIVGMSRACLAQLTRHRHTSPTVESQRYVDQSESEVIVPKTVQDNPSALEIFNYAVQDAKTAYQLLRVFGIPKEDARYILPEGTETQEYISMNLRELLHICSLRLPEDAQWEIRETAGKMRDLVLLASPELEFMFPEVETK